MNNYRTNLMDIAEIDIKEIRDIALKAVTKTLDISLKDAIEVVNHLLTAEVNENRGQGIVRIPWLSKVKDMFHNLDEIEVTDLDPITRFLCKGRIGYVGMNTIIQKIRRDFIKERKPFRLYVAEDIFPSGAIGLHISEIINDSNLLVLTFGTTPPLVNVEEHAGKKKLGTNTLAIGFKLSKNQDLIFDSTFARTSVGDALEAKYYPQHFKESNYLTSKGDFPRSVEELFNEQGLFSGSINALNSTHQGKQQGLLITIQLLVSLLAANNSNIGNLVFLVIDRNSLSILDEAKLKEIIEGIGVQNIPGLRNKLLTISELPQRIAISSKLLAEIVALSK